MIKVLKGGLVALFIVASVHAQAQRLPVPIVDFKDIPVAAATNGKAIRVDQVKGSIEGAARRNRWVLAAAGDGALQATFNKGDKHAVVVLITYTAAKYSLTYKDSVNMRFTAFTPNGPNPSRPDVIAKQAALFAKNPDTPYSVVRDDAFIHPFYESWVHDLLDSVRAHLKVAD